MNTTEHVNTGSRIEKSKEQLGKRKPSSREIIENTIKKMYPNMSQEMVTKTSKAVVLSPNNDSFDVDGKDVSVRDLQIQVADNIEKLAGARKKGGKDMSYSLAESLELLNSETNSQQEYFDWFDESDEIIKNMTDGNVTTQDLEQRNNWIHNTYTREAEMMTCLGLYKSSKSSEAAQKYSALYNKLIKMRQFRSEIRESTQSYADMTTAEKAAAKQVADTLRSELKTLAKMGVMSNLSRQRLEELKIYHGNDEEFKAVYDELYAKDGKIDDKAIMEKSYPFDEVLKQHMMAEAPQVRSTAYSRSPAEEFLANTQDGKQTEETIAERIMRLTGRRPPLNQHPKVAFSSEKFNAANLAYMREKQGLNR